MTTKTRAANSYPAQPAVRKNSATTKPVKSVSGEVIGGVDTHGHTHHGAVIDAVTGKLLGDQEFPATTAGYRQLLAWMNAAGAVLKVGIEGTGSYGAGLYRHLDSQGVPVLEVTRPNRQTRRLQGKSDPIDAINAARAVLSETATAQPKPKTGHVEAIRLLRTTRASAVKARKAAIQQMHGLLYSAPEDLRELLAGLNRAALVARCARLRPDHTRLHDPAVTAKAMLRRLAHRVQRLDEEISEADTELAILVESVAPSTLEVFGVGPEAAGQLLTTIGQNPDRFTTEAALARLCGVAPIPASSGNSNRHRLHRGGDRQANSTLYMIIVNRLRWHEPTRAYVEKRTSEGKTKKEIIRCLKRALIREIYRTLKTDLQNLAKRTSTAA